MKGIKPKHFVIIFCAAMFALTLLIRSQIYSRQPGPPVPALGPESQGWQEAIVIHFHNRRPFYIRNGEGVSGLVINPIAESFRSADIPHVWQETPARRQLDIIEKNEDRSCAAGWFKTPERQVFARYTLPVYQDKPFVAVFRTDNELLPEADPPLDQVLGERRLKLLVKEGYSYGHFIDERLKALAPRQVSTTGENRNILQMIENYRADYSFMTEEEAEDLLTTAEVQRETFRIVRFSDMPPGGKRYIICSRKVGEDIIARLDAAIRSQNPHEAGR